MREWVSFADKHGLNIHVGRVGTLKAFQDCISCGVTSADGSALVRNRKIEKIPLYLDIAEHEQKRLDCW